MTEPQAIDRLFQAMADPSRRQFIETLARGPASASRLAETAGVQLPAVLKHLQVLEDRGLVVSQKVGRVRTFSMRPETLMTMRSWIEQRQHELNMAFDRLADLMANTPEEKDH